MNPLQPQGFSSEQRILAPDRKEETASPVGEISPSSDHHINLSGDVLDLNPATGKAETTSEKTDEPPGTGEKVSLPDSGQPIPVKSSVPIILTMEDPELKRGTGEEIRPPESGRREKKKSSSGNSGQVTIQDLWEKVSGLKRKGQQASKDEVIGIFKALHQLSDASEERSAELLRSRMKRRAERAGITAEEVTKESDDSRLQEEKSATTVFQSAFLNMEQPWLSGEIWNTLAEEVKSKDYIPDEGIMNALEARMSVPTGQAGHSIFVRGELGDSDFRGAVAVLKEMKLRDPALLDGFLLRNTRGIPLSLESALADRIITDPQGLGSLSLVLDSQKCSALDQRAFMENIHILLRGNKRVINELFDRVSVESSAGRDLAGLSREGIMGLALLQTLRADKEDDARVEYLMNRHLFRPQDNQKLSAIVNEQRKKLSGELARLLQSEEASPAQKIDAMKKIVLMGFCSGMPVKKALMPYLTAIMDGLGNLKSSADYPKLRDDLIKSAEEARANAGRLGSMSLSSLAELEILTLAGSQDNSQMRVLLKFFDPEIRKRRPKGENAEIALQLLNEYRLFDMSENDRKLQNADLLRSERFRLLKKNEELRGIVEPRERERALQETQNCFLKGLENTKGLEDLPTRFDDVIVATKVYQMLAPGFDDNEEIVRAWSDFRNVADTAPAIIERLRTIGLKRSERMSLLARNCEPARVLNSEEGIKIREDSIEALCNAIKGNTTSGLADLPGCFSNHMNAIRIYRTLAPGGELDEEIATEWKRFRLLLELVGGEVNLKDATKLYTVMKQRESKGEEWSRIQEELVRARVLGLDYDDFLKGANLPGINEALIVNDFDEAVSIGGIWLEKHDNLPSSASKSLLDP